MHYLHVYFSAASKLMNEIPFHTVSIFLISYRSNSLAAWDLAPLGGTFPVMYDCTIWFEIQLL